jgi:hypothetical protein
LTWVRGLGQTEDVLLRSAAVTAILLGIACDSPKPGAGPACDTVLPTSCASPIHYGDVAPVIEQRCAQPCHSGIPDGPWPLTDYDHVADWAEVIRDELARCSMPPPDSGISLDPAEKAAVLQWIRCGYPP